MAIPKTDTYQNYVRYAEHCLKMIGTKQDPESHSINREMAVEWLKLADDASRQLRQLKRLK